MTAPGPMPDGDDPLLAFEPFLHKQPRRNSITPTKQRKFIGHLAATGIVTLAALYIGVSMEALYKLRRRQGAEGFAAAWDEAAERGIDRLEANALERATLGVPDWRVGPNGDLFSAEQKYNENLVMFFLRNRRPEKYNAHIGPGHKIYERIRREVMSDLMQQAQHNREEVIAQLSAELDALRAREGEQEHGGQQSPKSDALDRKQAGSQG